jgi:hypothetical protein
MHRIARLAHVSFATFRSLDKNKLAQLDANAFAGLTNRTDM